MGTWGGVWLVDGLVAGAGGLRRGGRDDSEAHGNVAGIAVVNASGVTLRNNLVHDNAAGILILNLPGLEVEGGVRTVAYGNTIEANNGENFADPGTFIAGLPAGLGVMIVAADENELRGNTIRGNDTTGVLITSYSEVLFGPVDAPGFDIFPEGNYVHDNQFVDNGGAPEPAFVPLFGDPAAEVLDDGCRDPGKMLTPALVNCLDANGAAQLLAAQAGVDVRGGWQRRGVAAAVIQPVLA